MLYHILIDRFAVDDNNAGEVCFKGGNLKGILSALDYIQGLGVVGIILTPFYETDAYHGYHITDYKQVDPHFGTWDDVRRLVNEVHRRGMTIAADFVANHCHEKNRLYADGKHHDWFKYNKDGSVKGFAGLGFLPMFNTDNSEVRDYLTERGLKLCRLGFDAIRLDHATGPSYAFWRYFHNRIKEPFPNVQLIGEVWGEMDFKPRCRLRYWLNCLRYSAQEARQLEYIGIFDGVLDFCYQHLLCEAAHSDASIINNRILYKKVKSHFNRYPSNFNLWLFLDNHDLNRFLFECGQNRILLHEGIEFSKRFNMPYILFYGTEKEITNDKDIFDGTPYSDERVRPCLSI
ncbi:MAG: alpha-amylase family glycosyl hydrolase [Prevotella sp.]|nr:alpha-amylase family glycosyl hydrolase [Prevotella sp.]